MFAFKFWKNHLNKEEVLLSLVISSIIYQVSGKDKKTIGK